MKTTSLIATLAIMFCCVLIGSNDANALSSMRPPVYYLQADDCKTSDSCPADGDCTSSVWGCSGGKCASCTCEAKNCGCTCKSPDSGIFFGLDDTVDFTFRDMPFGGFITFLNDNLSEQWQLATTVMTVPPERTLSGDWRSTDYHPASAMRFLQEAADNFGVCVQASDETKSIVFYECR